MNRGLMRCALLGALLSACHPSPAVHTRHKVDAPPMLDASQILVKPGDGPVVELRLVFAAGSADDPRGQEGLTHVMLKSMLEGRAGRDTYAERLRAMYPMAAVLDGRVEREQTVVVARVHKDHLARFYPLLREVLLVPAFDDGDVMRVRARALSSLTQDLRGADDEALGKQTLQAMIYEGDSRAHPELGSASGLNAVTPQSVAQQWARLVCANRLTAAVSGPVDQELLTRLRRDLGALDRPSCTGSTPAFQGEAPSATRVWMVDKPEAQSVAISLGLPIDVTRDHPDYPALTLAAAYLGQHRTFAGLLMKEVREVRGLNYGDYAYAEHFEQDGQSRFPAPNVARRKQYFSVWIRPVRPEQAHFVLRLVMRELRRFVSDGLSEDEYARIQRFAERYFALYAQTEQQRLGNAIDDRFYGLDEPYLDGLRSAFRTLTREQFHAAVRRHLALERLQIAIVAPHAAELATHIVREEPSPITYSSEKPEAVLAEDQVISAYPLGLRESQFRMIPVSEWFD